jgi:hypothetical protein
MIHILWLLLTGEERSILIRRFWRCVWRRRKELEMAFKHPLQQKVRGKMESSFAEGGRSSKWVFLLLFGAILTKSRQIS